MPGVAIGRPIKNDYLYRWVLSIREKYGGKIVNRKSGVKEGLRALKNGAFLGIVGDQGMPDSGYSSPFFGKTAWTSPIPALLSYRTGVPIIVATTTRTAGKYSIDYSPPIWPDLTQPMENEIDRMMRLCLKLLEESIRKSPGEWLWQHNRWKQQTREKLKSRFRYDSLCVLLPSNKEEFDAILPHLQTLRTLYPREFITLVVPKSFAHLELLSHAEIQIYETSDQLLLNDFRFKLVFNFANHPKAKSHYKNLSAFEVVTLADLKKLAEGSAFCFLKPSNELLHMPIERFFSNASFLEKTDCTLEEQEFHHLTHVIRCRVGDEIELVNGKNELAEATIVAIEKKKAFLQINSVITKPPGKQIILAQAIPRFNRLEFILEKGTELGASAFWLFPGAWSEKSDFSVNQKERMHLLTISAMKQCGRLDLPEILLKPPLTEWQLTPTPIFYGDTRPNAPKVPHPLKRLSSSSSAPNGASPPELDHLDTTLKARGVHLNPNILRTDTAAIAFLAIANAISS